MKYEENVDTIKEFKDKYFFLSDFYNCPLYYDGLPYLNSEAAFQSAKCERKEDRYVFTMLSASESKKLGRRVPLRKDWEDIKIDVMKDVVISKFSNSEELKKKLLDTGKATLIEGNTWGDKFWGVDLESGVGENHLGKILMQVREELKGEQS